MFSVQFPYQTAIADAFGDDDAALATFVGLVQAGVTAISFVVSIVFANRIFARFGVVAAALILPVVYVLGFGTWLITFTLATAVAVSFSQQVVQRSISNAAWSALYTVVPSERRPQVLAFMDGVPGQLGASLSGVLLLAAGAIAAASLTPVFILGLATALICTWVVVLIRRRYGAALVQTLRAGLGEQVLEGGPGLAAMGRDQAVAAELTAALGDPMPSVRRWPPTSSGAWATRPPPTPSNRCLPTRTRRSARPRCGRWASSDRRRSARSPRALRRTRRRRCGRNSPWPWPVPATRPAADELLDGLLAAADPLDRATGLAAAARAGGPRLAERATTGLADESSRVRAAAAEAFAPALHAEGTDEPAAIALLVSALDDDALAVRRAAAQTLAGHDLAAAAMVEVLSSGSERAQEAAVRGLEGTGTEMIEPVRAWAHERIARVTRLRVHAAALQPADPSGIGAPDRASVEFLCGLIGRRERRTEAQLLTAIATLGAPEATGLLRRSLRAPDPDVRAQAIEALDALGDRELGREVVGLLDTEFPAGHEATDEALRSLGDDPDPWIRALALRAIGDRMTASYRELVDGAANDPDPIVRATAATMPLIGGRPVTETARTLDELERMVVLRRVPLFSELDPEDLQRIAVSAAERLYPAGEALVREGDFGDELIVIVSGTVSISKRDGDSDRFLRTYEAGDHIGELAVLRDRPRAATVTADADVRGLCIGGEALRAILQERPEAAMAMLATLAERISYQ